MNDISTFSALIVTISSLTLGVALGYGLAMRSVKRAFQSYLRWQASGTVNDANWRTNSDAARAVLKRIGIGGEP